MGIKEDRASESDDVFIERLMRTSMLVGSDLGRLWGLFGRLRSDLAAEREAREKAEHERDGAIEYLRRAHVTNNDLRAQLAQRTEELAKAEAWVVRTKHTIGQWAIGRLEPASAMDAIAATMLGTATSALDSIVAERTAALEQRVAELRSDNDQMAKASWVALQWFDGDDRFKHRERISLLRGCGPVVAVDEAIEAARSEGERAGEARALNVVRDLIEEYRGGQSPPAVLLRAERRIEGLRASRLAAAFSESAEQSAEEGGLVWSQSPGEEGYLVTVTRATTKEGDHEDAE